MRKAIIAALVAPLLLLGFVEQTVAQQRGNPAVRAAPVPPPLDSQVRFRPRNAAERAAAASRLGARVTAVQLGAAFSITPRAPFIADRVAMQTVWMSLDARFDTTGRLQGRTNLGSDVQFWIANTANHRFLIDCSVSTLAPLPIRMIAVGGGSGNQAIISDVHPSAGRVSFVTQNIPTQALISLSMPAPANTQDIYAWDFMGCEVTPLPA
jgi:hypothetical protein